MNPVRILLADDHELVRKGLVRVLTEQHPEWQIVAEAADGVQAIEMGRSLKPDIAILDLSMPRKNGLQVTEELSQVVPGIRILILTMHAAEPIMRQLRRAGASAYMIKNEAPKQLVSAVERMLTGEAFFASESAYRPASVVAAPEYVPAQFLLTPREIAVLRLIASGKSNKELAAQLNMSVRTAESHRASIMAKLGVESLGDLVKIAVRDGIV
jgi:DNA-binding NarL/FixJ family response regulator